METIDFFEKFHEFWENLLFKTLILIKIKVLTLDEKIT